MAKILLIQPNRWGRGITSIWIPSHAGILKSRKHDVKLFDCTFYKNWTENELDFNTQNQQYQPTEYSKLVKYNDNDIFNELQKLVNSFKPDIIFWSGISSHIHGEGEYVNIQYGNMLVEKIFTSAKKIAGGLQPTGDPKHIPIRFPNIDFFIRGESELVLAELADKIDQGKELTATDGLIWKKDDETIINKPQRIISDMDTISVYDYSVFDDQIFLRPYNGRVVKGVDYELARGCVYACSYCVETTIQQYYGFTEITDQGTIKNASAYLRSKSAKRVFQEIKMLNQKFGIEFFRCQDTNFLTIDHKMLNELAELINNSELPIYLYVETRPEGINKSSIELLKKLKVDGVGMGIEVSSEAFRKNHLNRFPAQDKIIEAFSLLKDAGIKRTSYNIIGLPNETEDMIIDTIKFNSILQPDNITVAFYSPYLGTNLQEESEKLGDFNDYEYNVDNQLRTVTKSSSIGKDLLNFYKKNFTKFVRNGLEKLDELKKIEIRN
tara:strand:+ start:8439 stop:9923 length:1485 start_codon:yes stop_codon:yes gene_type:complete